MPLSEHEQRQLEAIERSLYADDPKFARQVSSAGQPRRDRAALAQGTLLLVVGLVLLVLTIVSPIVGVVGFFVMLGGLVRISSALMAKPQAAPAGRPGPQPGGGRGPGRPGQGRRRSPRPSGSWTEKAEERWRQRLEGEDR